MGNYIHQEPHENFIEHSASTKEELQLIKKMANQLHQTRWSIDFTVYLDSKWKKVLPLIRRAGNQDLIVSHVKALDILPRIVHIQFENLISLTLRYNMIISIEAIPKLNAPMLQRLEISSNKIINTRSLRKLWCPNLTQLILIQNLINDSYSLTELNCHSEFDSLQMFAPSKRVLPENINWVVKMKISRIRIIEYYDRNIIRNSRMRDMIKQKYVNCNVVMRYDAIQ